MKEETLNAFSLLRIANALERIASALEAKKDTSH